MSCLVAFELKIGEFKPEYIGKINLYLEALDREVKKQAENPSVGVILCASYGDVEKNKDYAIKMASYYDNKIKVVCE